MIRRGREHALFLDAAAKDDVLRGKARGRERAAHFDEPRDGRVVLLVGMVQPILVVLIVALILSSVLAK